MQIFWSALPIVSTVLALLIGLRSLYAASIGVGAACAAMFFSFTVAPNVVISSIAQWFPLLSEVLLILGGGLFLSSIMKHAGAQADLAHWIESKSGQGAGAVLMIVHGITPFAESLTGFGIGVTVGIPLLAHLKLPPKQVGVIGLLGLCAVPWGSMGPGSLIAAKMSNVSFYGLGTHSAVISFIPFVLTGIAAVLLSTPSQGRKHAISQAIVSGLMLTMAIAGFNLVFGTSAAGALGSLTIILSRLIRVRKSTSPPLGRAGRRGLESYGILLGGVLVVEIILSVVGANENWRYLASPALWLFVASLWFSIGRPVRKPARAAWHAWLQVAPVTALFIMLGVLMAVSGMATFLAQILSGIGPSYLLVAPFVSGLGGFLTGSNSGANAMLAATQASIARGMNANIVWFMAAQNVSAAFFLMASPGKVEMASQLAGCTRKEDKVYLQKTMLIVSISTVFLVSVFYFFYSALFQS
ncbi:L-lactate permease (plasmid) [Neokomagataea tanensis]|uniref:L-lactate permease n=2 Tax=Acetobacteraceae TaxID=433 RepID=A0A4Y6VCF9_9PROT|nr:L-lactate permease [Neokomagataea tanensis]